MNVRSAGLDFAAIDVGEDEAGQDEEEVHEQIAVPEQGQGMQMTGHRQVKEDDHQGAQAAQGVQNLKSLLSGGLHGCVIAGSGVGRKRL